MFDAVKAKAANTAKRAGLLSGGLLAIVVGLAFFTAAAWSYLAAVTDPLTANLIAGGVYAGLGLVLVGIASAGSSTGHEVHHRPTAAYGDTQNTDAPPLMQAFLHGMQAGVSATHSRRH